MFKSRRQYWRNIIAALVLVFGLTMPTTTPQAQGSGNPGVIPPNARPYGKTYGEWSAKWWQWVYSIPAPVNPNIDATGANCGQGQSGPVWFLGGNFGGTSTRNCTVPAGKALFFPLINQEADNFLCTDPDTTFDLAGLYGFADFVIDLAGNLQCKVDGVPIQNLQRYRAVSPVFSITLPEDNLVQALATLLPYPPCADGLPGTYAPAVSDGYWLMLAPLPPGEHTTHFHSELPDFGFALDITYTITVAP